MGRDIYKKRKDGLIYETKSLAALMMAGVMVLGLCACNSTTPDTSGSDSTPVSITTTESWDFSTGFYPAMSPATSNGTYGFTYYARNCYDTLVVRKMVNLRLGWPKRGTSAMMD